MSLVQQFAAYAAWRDDVSARVSALRHWLVRNELAEVPTVQRLEQMQERLRDDQLRVAFVAEFSRGKSELINAIFFADFGTRILPSAAGRTTMCPTELHFDAGQSVGIALLPIETRAENGSISDFRRRPAAWQRVAFDVASPESMQSALMQVSETRRVTPDEAGRLGFPVGDEAGAVYRLGEDGLVEVPRWRHAMINFPHPLLRQGLVILDTPGLNAIGAEPELTLSLLPNAQAVLFILAADAGVTQSDLAVWQEHIGAAGFARRGRLVVLNKIDAQWDELKSLAEIDAEIERQAVSSAELLDVPLEQVFPVSAQKGLVAKINGDPALLARSRLARLESALSEELIPAQREIVSVQLGAAVDELSQRLLGLCEARLGGLEQQLAELRTLRGKNKGVVEYMLGKVRAEKADFEAGLQRYYAVRSVFSSLSNGLFARLGRDAGRQLAEVTRERMQKAAFSRTLNAAMTDFFSASQAALQQAEREIGEIETMMTSVYKTFAVEHGLRLGAPTRFSLSHYRAEIDRLQQWCDEHLTSMVNLLTHDKQSFTQRFLDEVASQVQRAFEQASRDAEAWLRAIMAPLEGQIREFQGQLRRRLDNILRIHQASDSLEERLRDVGDQAHGFSQQADTLREMLVQLQHALSSATRLTA